MTLLGVLALSVVQLAPPPLPAGGNQPGPPEVHEVVLRLGDSTIRALCTDGRRDVLLMHGAETTADSWRSVLERLDGRVGACAYDRRGTGSSGPAPGERGWFELLDELLHVHGALGFDRGYLLVGQGLGGLYARLYAADRVRDVGALLLLDPAHERMAARMEAGVPPDAWEEWVDRLGRPNGDGLSERAIGRRASRARLPAIPVTVITATRRELPSGWDERFAREAAEQLHAEILRGAEPGRHIPAPHSGPVVQRDQPGLVVDELLRLVRLLPRQPRGM